MWNVIFEIYLFTLLAGTVVGVYNYKHLDRRAKLMGFLLLMTLLSESVTFVLVKNKINQAPLYHFFNIFEAQVITMYFLETIKVKRFTILSLTSLALWSCVAICNMIFFQPLSFFNSNMLIAESFSIIAMSIFSLYTILRDDSISSVFRLPHFWIWTCLLLFWSSTFFFWAVITPLYKSEWYYKNVMLYFQGVMNILVYAGIGIALWRYRKLKANVS